MQEQMSGAAMNMPNDPKVPFKAEWEALEIVDHQWVLTDIENQLLKQNNSDHANCITNSSYNKWCLVRELEEIES